MISNTDFMEQLDRYYSVWQEYNYVYEEWAKAHGMSVNSLLLLSAIHEGGKDCTQRKISQRWMIPKQTINMILKEFERKGLVELFPMQKDKRNKLIRFTQAGDEYADAIISRLRKVELYVIEEMGMERMKQLNDNMALFAELFSRAGERDGNEKNE
ncbi:MAG: MarR family winged helix-turn-helix transcriptional regulator [Acutalibacteraceae bacterium]